MTKNEAATAVQDDIDSASLAAAAAAEKAEAFIKAGLSVSDSAFDGWAAGNVVKFSDYFDISDAECAEPAPAAPEGVESAEDSAAAPADPQYMNDAEVLGVEVDGFADFLNKPATLMLGEMWGARDRRNTLDEQWNNTTMSWIQWINGGEGDKNTPAWGFSRHPVGKDKAGHCFVLGSSVGRARKAKAMSEMYAMGLDIDSGAKLDDVIAKIEELGLFGLVYTSWNHNKTGLQLKRDDVLRKLQIKTDPSITEIRRYLRDFDKNRYEESFIAGCTIKSAKKQVKDGVVIELDTPPLEKFRLIFPLEESVKIIDLAETHEAALAVWEDKITGLAQNVLGVHFDTSATDSSRLFFGARHAKGSEDWYAAVVMGKPLRFADVEPFKKSTYTSKREVNAFTMAGDADDDRPAQAYTPSGKSLNDWHRSAKDRFMMAELLETLCSDRIRHSGGEAQGHVHIECPFGSEHSSEGGTGTMAINALDAQTGFWATFCHHDSCQGRHKLQHLEEMLRQGWFDEEVLFDTSHGFLLEGADGEDDPLEPDAVKKARWAEFEARCEAFDYETTTQADVATFIGEVHATGLTDEAVRERISTKVSKNTALKVDKVRGIWTALDNAARADAREKQAEARRKSPPAPFLPLDEATQETVERAAETAGWLPSFVTYRDGWFYAVDFERPDAGPRPVCRAFEVPYVAFGETEAGRTNEITIRYRHRSAQRGVVESTYQIGDTYRDSGTLLSRLVDEGFETDPMAKTQIIVSLLRSVNTDNEAVLREKSGWIGDTYVSPSGAVANAKDVRYILHPKARVSERTQGTLALHNAYATTALTGVNGKYILPGYLSGLVGCLVDFIGNDVSPIIALEGKSSTGKTSAGKMGAAHFAPPDNTGLFMKADNTPTATETYAERANGASLVLDEEGSAKFSAEEKQRLILQWGDGSGRGRGKRDGGVQTIRTWQTCFVTSAEQGFVNRLSAEGADALTGAIARVFSVNFDAVAKLADGSDDLKAIRALSGDDSTSAVYGFSGLVFAEKLASLGREEVKARVVAVMDDWNDLSSSAARRVVRLAALFVVAGEIAKEAGLFGDVLVRQHMRELLTETLEARMVHLDTDQQQLEALRREVRKALQTGSIVSMHEDREYNRQEVLGYFGHFADNGKLDDKAAHDLDRATQQAQGKDEASGNSSADDGATRDAVDAELMDRIYILPLDRLGKLGIKTDHKALGDRVDSVGGLVTRKKGERDVWFHDYVPGEGSSKNIRVKGSFIHG
jgi:hypothetical protein